MKKALRNFNTLTRDLLHVIYPNECLVCAVETPHSRSAVCPICESDLQFTHFEDYNEPTPLDQLFWGRVQLESTYALLYFERENDTQKILHALKYKDRPDIANYFGERLGEQVKQLPQFQSLDALVPVPLHPKKEFLRGYNQSRMLANGISEQIGVPVNNELLRRVAFTESQTKKGKFLRWDNMQGRFAARNTNSALRHVAVVDDMVTTGATLEVCVRMLQETLPECRVSIISLATAR